MKSLINIVNKTWSTKDIKNILKCLNIETDMIYKTDVKDKNSESDAKDKNNETDYKEKNS